MRERCVLDTSYGYGVGLTLELNVMGLDVPGVVAAMDRFFDRYETPFLRDGIKVFDETGPTFDKGDTEAIAQVEALQRMP